MTARSLALTFVLALAASGAASPAAEARGETSRPPQRTIVAAAPPALVARTPRWSRRIRFADPLYAGGRGPSAVPFRPDDGFPRDPPLLVAGGGLVFAAVGARTCAFADDDGSPVWCAPGAARRLALGHGEVVAVARGSATAYDARSGRRRWRVPADGASASPRGFVLVRGASGCAEVSPRGTLLWQAALAARIDAQPVAVGPRTLLQHGVRAGARFADPLFLLRSGADGGARALPAEATALLEVRGGLIYTSGGWRAQPVEDAQLTAEVDALDLGAATPRVTRWHYEPDYDANRAGLGARTVFVGTVQSKSAAAEGDALYLTVLDRLYRYRLAAATGQHPLAIERGARWVGGPYGGALLLDRPDGLWIVRAGEGRTRETRALAHGPRVEVAALAVSDGNAYAALTDGTVGGFALRDGRRRLAAHLPCASYRGVAVGSTSVLFVCTSPPAPTVYAFPRLRGAA